MRQKRRTTGRGRLRAGKNKGNVFGTTSKDHKKPDDSVTGPFRPLIDAWIRPLGRTIAKTQLDVDQDDSTGGRLALYR